MRFSSAEYLAIQARLARGKQSSGEPVEGCDDESELHNQVVAEIKRRGWICFHGSMAHRALRTLGEPDLSVLADGGRVFFVELKTKTGKLSTEQLGLQALAEKLGHIIHVVRSFDAFLELTAESKSSVAYSPSVAKSASESSPASSPSQRP